MPLFISRGERGAEAREKVKFGDLIAYPKITMSNGYILLNTRCGYMMKISKQGQNELQVSIQGFNFIPPPHPTPPQCIFSGKLVHYSDC